MKDFFDEIILYVFFAVLIMFAADTMSKNTRMFREIEELERRVRELERDRGIKVPGKNITWES
jgi:hypothetical protein